MHARGVWGTSFDSKTYPYSIAQLFTRDRLTFARNFLFRVPSIGQQSANIPGPAIDIRATLGAFPALGFTRNTSLGYCYDITNQ